MCQDLPAAESFPVREEKDSSAAPEHPTCRNQVLYPLPGRRHGQDPEVRDAKIPPVDSLPPRLLVAEELPEKAGLDEAPSCDWHCAAVGFEKEVGTVLAFRLTLEAKPEDPIRLHAQAVGLAAVADLDLPAER